MESVTEKRIHENHKLAQENLPLKPAQGLPEHIFSSCAPQNKNLESKHNMSPFLYNKLYFQ